MMIEWIIICCSSLTISTIGFRKNRDCYYFIFVILFLLILSYPDQIKIDFIFTCIMQDTWQKTKLVFILHIVQCAQQATCQSCINPFFLLTIDDTWHDYSILYFYAHRFIFLFVILPFVQTLKVWLFFVFLVLSGLSMKS